MNGAIGKATTPCPCNRSCFSSYENSGKMPPPAGLASGDCMAFFLDEPLQDCCREARHDRLHSALPNARASILAPMLFELVATNAPDRLSEITQTLFGVFFRRGSVLGTL